MSNSLKRAGAGKSFAGDGRLEANLCPSAAARTWQERCPDRLALGYTRRHETRLATALLRFRCVHREEARGKAAGYAPQSCPAGFSFEARGVVVEQLPTVRLWRTRPGS